MHVAFSRWPRLVAPPVLALGFAAGGPAQDELVERLPAEHRRWLDDEVAYIITERERDVFLSLETLEEREAFIEVFWRKRDPVPATPRNEFRDEHYRRLEHADREFREILSIPGRKTDRGRMYVILGEPRGRERFDHYSELVTAELWFYQGDPSLGVPRFFHLVFFKPQDAGTFRLYSPALDGPGQLLRGQAGARPQLAFDNLYRISPELARASITFDASEPVDRSDVSAAVLGTELVMARIEESPGRAVRTDYIDGWLRYGNRVSADYSFNFVPSRSTFAVMLGPDGTSFLHYAVELDFANFPVETDESRSKFYTTLDVSLEIREAGGALVLADDKESYIELSPSQVEAMEGSSFSYQDGVPLVPGDYRVTVILRNRVLQQFTAAEGRVSVEAVSSAGPALSDVVPGFQLDEETDAAGLQTFQIGGTRLHPAADGLFAIGDDVYAVLQGRGIQPGHELRIALVQEESVLQRHTVSGADLELQPIVQRVPLAGMVGGRYQVRAELVDDSGEVLAKKAAPITVSPRTSVPRPAFTARRSFDAAEPGLLALTLGDQLWSLGRFEEARAKLEESVAADNPNLPMAKWKLAGAYVREREVDRALALLIPLEKEYPDQYEVVLGLGLSYYVKEELDAAATFLERAMAIRAPGTSLLNALGDVYVRLGKRREARDVFERSLELDPDQSDVRARLSDLSN